MDQILAQCKRLHNLVGIPMTLVSSGKQILYMAPRMPEDFLDEKILDLLLTDFRLQKCGISRPLIYYIEPGYFMGICALPQDSYGIIGLLSPIPHSRHEILSMCASVIKPNCLQQFCDMMSRMPLYSLDQVKEFLCLLIELTCGKSIPKENILFNDIYLNGAQASDDLTQELFRQRENVDFHVPTDFESAICHAIEIGSQEELMKTLYSPAGGRVGKMSANEIRQEKYAMVCMATLASRAAIRGGLPKEIAFNMSDSFCQCADQATDIPHIQRIVFSMLIEYCGKVRQHQGKHTHSPTIVKCLDYISDHLHETITLDTLSDYCNLCSRSLSLRFRTEMGMGIPEYIHREKIKEAQYLLCRDDYSLSEISFFLNYPSQSYFTQVFKKYCGLTPQQYRESKTCL